MAWKTVGCLGKARQERRCGRGVCLLRMDDAMASVWAALAEGPKLKAATAEHLNKVLRKADIAGAIESSHPRAVAPDSWD